MKTFIIILLLASFSHYRLVVVIHWSLTDCKFSLVYSTLLRILVDLSNAVDWIISILLLIFSSFRPFSRLLEIVPSTPTRISIILTLIFHSSLTRSKYFSVVFFFVFFDFYFVVCRSNKLHKIANSLFYWINTRSRLLAWVSWSLCISKPQRILYVSFLKTDSGLCLYH